jgi:tetratricopeptide (TPR) repeat protein
MLNAISMVPGGPMRQRSGRSLLAGLALVLAASCAWALPSPKDIEQAVNAGEYHQAESMLREVIKEKPSSAKAQYELGEVLAREGRNVDARSALLEAQRLDPSLKFASDPQRFKDLLSKIPAGDKPALSSPAVSAAGQGGTVSSGSVNTLPSRPVSSGGFPWMYLLIAGGVIYVVWRIASRVLTAPAAGPLMSSSGPGFGSPSAAPGYGPSYGPGYGAPAQGGMGVGGVVLGGLAGAAAGYGLAKVLEHGDEGRPVEHHNSLNDGGGFTPIDNPPDYGSFDAGSGSSDSWDSGGGGGGGSNDDSW